MLGEARGPPRGVVYAVLRDALVEIPGPGREVGGAQGWASNNSIWLNTHSRVHYLVSFSSDPIRCLALRIGEDFGGVVIIHTQVIFFQVVAVYIRIHFGCFIRSLYGYYDHLNPNGVVDYDHMMIVL